MKQVTTKSSASDHHVWSDFGHAGVIRQWADEIKTALVQEATADVWSLVGRAVFIEHADIEESFIFASQIANHAGLSFRRISSEDLFVRPGDEIDLDTRAPGLLYLEPGDWSSEIEPKGDADQNQRLAGTQEQIEAFISEFKPTAPVLLITSGDKYQCLASRFRSRGLFDRRFEIRPLTLVEQGNQFLDGLGREICGNSLLDYPARIGQLLDIELDDKRRRGLAIMSLMRKAYREKRKLEFVDLVQVGVHGTAESDLAIDQTPEYLRRTAVHEAGHATIAILDSAGENIPDYAAVGIGGSFTGVVAESYAFRLNRETDQIAMRHRIRICLAGRAAEEVVFGCQGIGTRGLASDLENATTMAARMFATCGMQLDIDDRRCSSDNLAVVVETPSPSEMAHVENLTREFLGTQYRTVLALMEANRELLDAIADALLKQKFLSQEALNAIVQDKVPNRTRIASATNGSITELATESDLAA